MNFEEVYKQYEPMIYAMLRKLNIFKDQDEYIQIGRIAIWEATTSYEPSMGNLQLYMYMKIKYAMLQQLRRQLRNQKRELQQDKLPEASKDFKLEEHIVVQQLLQSLPQEERFIVIAYYERGLKNKEIAQLLGKTTEAIKKKRQRIILNLKSVINNTKNF